MTSKGDKSFKAPSNVGKLTDLNTALEKTSRGVAESELTKQERSWIFKAVTAYQQPIILVSTGLDLDRAAQTLVPKASPQERPRQARTQPFPPLQPLQPLHPLPCLGRWLWRPLVRSS